MRSVPEDWPREHRELPDAMRAEVLRNRGGSIAEIDGSRVPDPNGYVPSEAIRGLFFVGVDGVPTGEYARNPRYGPIADDFTRLESPNHWLGWLPSSPGESVRASVAATLADQVAGAELEWLKVIDEPVFITGGPRSADDPSKVTVRRAAMAVPFALSVVSPNGRREVLTGAFSWVAANLDQPGQRRDRTWFDIGFTRQQAADALHRRVYALD